MKHYIYTMKSRYFLIDIQFSKLDLIAFEVIAPAAQLHHKG